jgi:hypothetical protein
MKSKRWGPPILQCSLLDFALFFASEYPYVKEALVVEGGNVISWFAADEDLFLDESLFH